MMNFLRNEFLWVNFLIFDKYLILQKFDMKKTLSFFMILNFIISFSQEKLKFEIINLKAFDSIKIETIEKRKDEVLDIFFYKKHFQTPYHLPNNFFNSKFKNETYTFWNNGKEDLEHKLNWSYSYQYDNFSRLISYSYSGCLVCSQLPYIYKVEYDKKGNVRKIYNETDINDVMPSLNSQYPPKIFSEYIFTYNNKNQLIDLKEKVFNKIIKSIRVLNFDFPK